MKLDSFLLAGLVLCPIAEAHDGPSDPTRAQRGGQRFYSGQAGQCIQCHRLRGRGRAVGPDLDGIARKRSREQLLESILQPSKTISPQYLTYLALLDDGTIVTGLKVRESSAVVVLKTAEGETVPLLKLEIETLKAQPQSLMPDGIASEMTTEELADLMAFLCSLK